MCNGTVVIVVVIFNDHALGSFYSLPRISPETQSGPTDLFFPIAAILFLMILVSMVNGLLEILSCIFGILPSLLKTDE
jgi:hypothetical protein